MAELPVTRMQVERATALERDDWSAALPCVQQLARDGLELGPLTVLVGENGSGKSTLVEAIAQAYGLSPEGGSTGARHSTRVTESPLGRRVHLDRGIGASRWGYFLRAETMHGLYSYLEDNPPGPRSREPRFHEMSHGESFVSVLSTRFDGPGLYLLDEPESALSFTGCLALVNVLKRIAASGTAQAVVATHSPVLAAAPSARVLELDTDGFHETAWAELELVQNWRAFLERPDSYLRHLD